MKPSTCSAIATVMVLIAFVFAALALTNPVLAKRLIPVVASVETALVVCNLICYEREARRRRERRDKRRREYREEWDYRNGRHA